MEEKNRKAGPIPGCIADICAKVERERGPYGDDFGINLNAREANELVRFVRAQTTPPDAALREAVEHLSVCERYPGMENVSVDGESIRTLLRYVRAVAERLDSIEYERNELQHMQCAHYHEESEVCAVNFYWPGVDFWKCEHRAVQAPRLTGDQGWALKHAEQALRKSNNQIEREVAAQGLCAAFPGVFGLGEVDRG